MCTDAVADPHMPMSECCFPVCLCTCLYSLKIGSDLQWPLSIVERGTPPAAYVRDVQKTQFGAEPHSQCNTSRYSKWPEGARRSLVITAIAF
jgi:hypothetical protein